MTVLRTVAGNRTPDTRRAGFTLVELIMVMAIITVLASIAVPLYHNSLVRAQEAALLEDLYIMRDSIDKYYLDHGEYPYSLSTLVEGKYMRIVPMDPLTESADSWNEVPADDGTGIYDVHSGSDSVGRNGVPYSQW